MTDKYQHQGPATGVYPDEDEDHEGRPKFWQGFIMGYPSGVICGVVLLAIVRGCA